MNVPSHRYLLGCLAVLALGWATPGMAATEAPRCPDNFLGYGSLDVGQNLTCSCSPDQIAGTVWGTDRYTADSSVCTAARHAGRIGAKGGNVTVFREGNCPGVAGSTRRGITTLKWGPYDTTFAFEHPAPPCLPEVVETPGEACPANMLGLEARPTSEALECTCAREQLTGSVWGTDLYTFDSSICLAARHAGMIPATGGSVTVFAAGRCATFAGSSRNGVTTSQWGAYDHTFAFRFPLPSCADGAAVPKK